MSREYGSVAKKKLICYSEEKRGALMSEQSQNPFKWRHFPADIILLGSSAKLMTKEKHCLLVDKERAIEYA
jgi:hypothetical protein